MFPRFKAQKMYFDATYGHPHGSSALLLGTVKSTPVSME